MASAQRLRSAKAIQSTTWCEKSATWQHIVKGHATVTRRWQVKAKACALRYVSQSHPDILSLIPVATSSQTIHCTSPYCSRDIRCLQETPEEQYCAPHSIPCLPAPPPHWCHKGLCIKALQFPRLPAHGALRVGLVLLHPLLNAVHVECMIASPPQQWAVVTCKLAVRTAGIEWHATNPA